VDVHVLVPVRTPTVIINRKVDYKYKTSYPGQYTFGTVHVAIPGTGSLEAIPCFNSVDNISGFSGRCTSSLSRQTIEESEGEQSQFPLLAKSVFLV
jgi:hypothetical protein